MNDYCKTDYNKNLEMLSIAAEYCAEQFNHTDIINCLSGNDDLKKQICLIELSYIENQNEADILADNLTGQSGPIREAASYKILELIQKDDFKPFFQTEDILNSFSKAVIDINPSVSRNAVRIIKYADNKKYIYNNLIEEINRTLSDIESLKDKHSYAANKKHFNLYWNLEALSSLADSLEADWQLLKILEKTAFSHDYTIREKTAKAAKAFNVQHILELLKDDSNMYVRRYL